MFLFFLEDPILFMDVISPFIFLYLLKTEIFPSLPIFFSPSIVSVSSNLLLKKISFILDAFLRCLVILGYLLLGKNGALRG